MVSAGRLVCVFGISGIGKTTLIQEFVRQHKDWHALSAGELLAQLSSRGANELRAADRSTVERNQALLANAIHEVRILHPDRNWLLDAHAVIDNDRELILVPVHVIERIHPDLMIFLHADAWKIHRRRMDDPNRVRPLPIPERIEEEQALAWQTCLQYSTVLKIDLLRVSAADAARFEQAISGRP
jgi:adenylate kinase